MVSVSWEGGEIITSGRFSEIARTLLCTRRARIKAYDELPLLAAPDKVYEKEISVQNDSRHRRIVSNTGRRSKKEGGGSLLSKKSTLQAARRARLQTVEVKPPEDLWEKLDKEIEKHTNFLKMDFKRPENSFTILEYAEREKIPYATAAGRLYQLVRKGILEKLEGSMVAGNNSMKRTAFYKLKGAQSDEREAATEPRKTEWDGKSNNGSKKR